MASRGLFDPSTPQGAAHTHSEPAEQERSARMARAASWSDPIACSALCLLILDDRRHAEAGELCNKELQLEASDCDRHNAPASGDDLLGVASPMRHGPVRTRREAMAVARRISKPYQRRRSMQREMSKLPNLLKRRRVVSTDAEVVRPRRLPLPVAIYTQHIASFLRFEAPLPNMLYVFGGRIPLAGIHTLQHSQGVVQNNVDMLDTWRGAWVQCPPMPVNRAGGAAACLPDGRIMLAGGYDERGVLEGLLASCDAYDPFHQSWEQDVAHLLRPRWGHSCVELRGKIYAIGGCSVWEANAIRDGFVETLRSCEVYSPGGDWKTCAPLQVARSGARAVTLQQRYLVVVGGCEDPFGRVAMQGTVELFDPDVGFWELLGPTLASPRTCAAVAPVDDYRVLVLGGNDPEYQSNQARGPEIYQVCAPPCRRYASAEDEEQGSRAVTRHGIAGLSGAEHLFPEGPDPLAGRVGCQAVTLTLPSEGSEYPLCNRRYLLVIGGERCDRTHDLRMFARTFDFDTKRQGDIQSEAWRENVIPAPLALPRTAVALCVGLGHVSKAS